MPFSRFSQPALQVLASAEDEAKRMKIPYLPPEHILLGLSRFKDGIQRTILPELGKTPDDVRRHVVAALSK